MKLGLKKYPTHCCYECGVKASDGRCFQVSSWYPGKCGICGKNKSVTEVRDWYYPKLKKINEVKKELNKKRGQDDSRTNKRINKK